MKSGCKKMPIRRNVGRKIAKHDGQERIWIDGAAHTVLLELKAATGDSIRHLASVAIEQYGRRRGRKGVREKRSGGPGYTT